ncbi:hypothetical protein EHS25_009037 [Saitozyma podzolica]|uniref:Thaumatin-like protein 1 n=1 Tax=Saitozyma podzolica TaxID=1890683 RepID=A0A427YKN8_9TREE|nr:hypothetical protein EHS25_009037 [Saitozyma podzolica]
MSASSTKSTKSTTSGMSTMSTMSTIADPAAGRQITVLNQCGSTIWPAMYTGGSAIPTQPTGWELASGDSTTFTVDDSWSSARIWARTGCTATDAGDFECLTGGCGAGTGGDVTCTGTGVPPATLAEFTLSASGTDNYDISLVDGFSIPLNIIPSASDCPAPECAVNINPLCPGTLRTAISENGLNLACMHPCNAGYGQETFGNRDCCTVDKLFGFRGYNDPALCQSCGVDFYDLFKDSCNTAYAYAYDDQYGTALWTCPGSSLSDYTIAFCPNGTDYVGSSEPSGPYLDATATCTSMVTSYSTTFSVGPSPTSTDTSATLSVVVTAASGVDSVATQAATSTTSAGSAGSVVSSGAVAQTSAAGSVVVALASPSASASACA